MVSADVKRKVEGYRKSIEHRGGVEGYIGNVLNAIKNDDACAMALKVAATVITDVCGDKQDTDQVREGEHTARLTDEELIEWAVYYIELNRPSIDSFGGLENYYHVKTPIIPNMGGIKAYFEMADLPDEVNKIYIELKQAYRQGKKDYTMTAINGQRLTINLVPLFKPDGFGKGVDDLTLQKYVCRLYIHPKGG